MTEEQTVVFGLMMFVINDEELDPQKIIFIRKKTVELGGDPDKIEIDTKKFFAISKTDPNWQVQMQDLLQLEATKEAIAESKKQFALYMQGQAIQAAPQQAAVTKKSNKDGEVLKCPSCGAPVGAFDIKCPQCGHEFRNRSAGRSVSEFFELYMNADSNEKANIVKAFPVPNTREDILTFLTMGIGNTKPVSGAEREAFEGRNTTSMMDMFVGRGQENTGLKELSYKDQEIAAWQAKVQQVIDMGKILFIDEPSQKMFEKYEVQLKKNSKKKLSKIAKSIMAFSILIIVSIAMLPLLLLIPSAEKETKKLNNLVVEITQDIQNGNLNEAQLKAMQLHWQFEPASRNSRPLVKEWNERREEMMKKIEELQSSK